MCSLVKPLGTFVGLLAVVSRWSQAPTPVVCCCRGRAPWLRCRSRDCFRLAERRALREVTVAAMPRVTWGAAQVADSLPGGRGLHNSCC